MKQRNPLHRLLNLLTLALFAVSCNKVWADNLPPEFVRVITLEELTDDAWYLIGGVSTTNGKFYLMKAEDYGDSKHMLKADYFETPIEGASKDRWDSLHLWRFSIKRKADSLQIVISDATGKNVVAEKKKTNLELSKSKGAIWNVVTANDETFHLYHSESNRSISIAVVENPYFGNFADNTKVLQIFKSIKNFTEKAGEETLPQEKSIYSIKNNAYIAAANLQPIPFTNYELSDGTIAYSEDLGCLTTKVDENAGTFTMANDRTGAFLSYEMTWSEPPVTWTIVNGHVATTETPTRFLIYNNGEFGVMTPDEISASTLATNAVFTPIGARPYTEMSEDGVLTLHGSWQKAALAALDAGEAKAIDATNIVLSRDALDFSNRPSPNVPIYIQSGQSEFAPEGWQFVVTKDGDTYTLLRSTKIEDRTELYLPYPVTIPKNHSLTYNREAYADGKWETLYLPFAANVPSGYEAYEFESIAEGAIKMKKATAIAAGTPTLIRSTSAGSSHKTVTIKATDCVASTEAKSDETFIGTFSPLVFGNAAKKTYLLESTGEAFILADADSKLAPFRCYIRTDAAQGVRFLINTDDKTGILSPVSQSAPGELHDLCGRRLKKAPRTGIYIRNNQKILNTGL